MPLKGSCQGRRAPIQCIWFHQENFGDNSPLAAWAWAVLQLQENRLPFSAGLPVKLEVCIGQGDRCALAALAWAALQVWEIPRDQKSVSGRLFPSLVPSLQALPPSWTAGVGTEKPQRPATGVGEAVPIPVHGPAGFKCCMSCPAGWYVCRFKPGTWDPGLGKLSLLPRTSSFKSTLVQPR